MSTSFKKGLRQDNVLMTKTNMNSPINSLNDSKSLTRVDKGMREDGMMWLGFNCSRRLHLFKR